MSDLRVAVLGVGAMGADHVARITGRISDARVVVVNDYLSEKAEQVAASVPGARVVGDPLDAIADPDVDAVVLATPGPTHEKQLLACLEHGKPVLCEKPLTTDVETSLAVVKREAELGKRLIQVGFMRRFDHEYAQLKALIDGGEFGQPLMLHCAHRNPAVPPSFDSAMVVRDSLVHEVDVTRFLFDEEIASIQIIKPAPNPVAPQGLADPQIAIMRTESGKYVDVELFVTTGVAYEVRTEVVAEKGSAIIGLDVGLVRKVAPGNWGGRITPGFRERFGQAYDTEFQRWVDAVLAGGTTGNYTDGPGAWDGYAAAAVCEAGVESLNSRQARRGPDGRPRFDQGGVNMKIALDPTPFHHDYGLLDFPSLVADLGYEYLQLTPHRDFIPFFNHPRADDDLVARFRKACADAGVGIASVLPVLRWSGPDEDAREAAVRNWKRVVQITVDLGVNVINTEFSGRPERAEESERAFFRSMEELVPIFEREGIDVRIDPHPDDFVEDGLEALRIIRGVNSPNIGMVYVACHTYHMGGNMAEIMRAAGDRLRLVHVADTMDHHRSHGLRYITNPPGNPARVHQHLKIGDGDVDWDEFFGGLAEIGFYDRPDTVMVSSVFAEDENAHEVSRYQLATMTDYVNKYRN